jgi:hypothetical protein
MAVYKVHKVTALPGTLEANSFYFVAPPGAPDFVELYVTGSSAATVKRLLNEADVQALIDSSVASSGAIEIVADITARNALTPDANITVLVLDATGDATVASGAATYVYRLSTTSWIKISEAESLDVALTWAAISGKPTSSAAAIDAAVAASHTHANLTQLGKIGEDGNGELTYNSQNVRARLDTGDW